jgi:hypothetical protein
MIKFTGDANVRYFSNGDLLVERVDVWSFANLEARVYTKFSGAVGLFCQSGGIWQGG